MADSEDVKPKDLKPEKINIIVTVNSGLTLKFALKKTQPLKKVFDAVTTKMRVAEGTYRFFHEGVRLRPQETPEDAGIEDDGEIMADLEQQGGSS